MGSVPAPPERPPMCPSSSFFLLIVAIAFLSALLWVSTNVFWNYAIRFLGLGAAAGLGSGLTMAVSFIWGATYIAALDNKPVKNLGGALSALGVLFFGIALVALAYTDRIQRLVHYFKCLARFEAPDSSSSIHDLSHDSPGSDHASVELEHHDDHHDDDDHDNDHDKVPLSPTSRRHAESQKPASSSSQDRRTFGRFQCHSRMQEKIAGTVMIVLAGFVNGSSLVPIKFAPTEAQGIQYMISFGIGVLIITPLLNFIYFGIIRREIPNFHYKIWVIPTFASISGLMWNVGNFSSVFATLLLGFTIGFPLTQLSLVVQALFGIVLFKEVTGKLEIIFYAIGVALILAGAFMLGSFA